MEFGKRSRFSIEIDIDDNCGGAWLFGHICYWVAGNVVGDYDAGTSLRDVLFQMKYIAGDRGRRNCPALMQLSERKAFEMISAALNETSDELYDFVTPDFMPASLDVRIPVDVFDSWKIFLVESSEAAKLLCFNMETSSLTSAILSLHEFDTVFANAYEYLDLIYESHSKSDGGS
ncbi:MULTISPECIES: Imm42 family immunity protein [Trinickia]|nr:Imm42 family immunity protein [Trinickia symbiotica]